MRPRRATRLKAPEDVARHMMFMILRHRPRPYALPPRRVAVDYAAQVQWLLQDITTPATRADSRCEQSRRRYGAVSPR